MCGGFLQALGVAYPDRIFVVGSMHPPAMEVVVIRASEIEVGLNLTWHVPDGASVPGRPFQMSVMDRKIDLGRLTSLYQNFLGHNPLPF